MIDYTTFLANAEAEDIHVLNVLAMGQPIRHTDPAEADAVFARIVRLEGAGFILRASRAYERRDGVLWQSFDAVVEPAATGYLARAASERIQLSRQPLPEVAP